MPDDFVVTLDGVAALLAGGLLGVFFYAGLWWTIRQGASSPTPLRWFFASLVVRTSIVLTGFYVVGAGQPGRMGLCLLGFILARVIVFRITRPVSTVRGPPCA